MNTTSPLSALRHWLEENHLDGMIVPRADAWQSELLKGLKVVLSKAEGDKCPRCWHYTTDIGKVAEHADICGRCVSNIAGDGEKRKFA